MRVLIADKFEDDGVAGLQALGCEVELHPNLTPDTLAEAINKTKAEVLVVRSTKVPAAVIEAVETLRLIIRAGSGYDSIDTDAAAQRKIPVCNTPGMNAVAVAELTMAHLLSLDRRLPDQHAAIKAGQWNKQEFSKARGLKGRSLLVIGLGAIGTEVIRRAQAFGMRVYSQSRSLRDDTARALGIEPIAYTREALVETLPHMDAVSVHIALTPETKNLCGPGFFAAMKPGSYFINTSRGDVVDEAALIKAVKEKGVRAGVDVYQNQPGFKQGEWATPMGDVDGVFGTHHVGASTDQAQLAVASEVVHIIEVFRESGKATHCVNGVQDH
ncbi:MAG: NAD(P)-dependent oxidoreductase [Planctomycetota bacterium]